MICLGYGKPFGLVDLLQVVSVLMQRGNALYQQRAEWANHSMQHVHFDLDESLRTLDAHQRSLAAKEPPSKTGCCADVTQ